MNQDKWTDKASEVIRAALELAREDQHVELQPIHVVSAIFQDAGGVGPQLLAKVGGNSQQLQRAIARAVGKLPKQDPAPERASPSNAFLKMMNKAQDIMKKLGDSLISVDHILVAAADDPAIDDVLKMGGLSHKALEDAVKDIRKGKKVDSKNAEATYDALNKYGRDLTKAAEQGKLDPVIGRDEEIRRVIRVLSRRTKNDPVLIGDPGVGKTAIVEGLAQRIVRGDIPETLKCQVFALDMGALVAGASYRGEFEDRLKSVIKEVTDSNGQIILFIDEIHTVLGAGRTSGAMDAANLLKPALARGELRVIGATTLKEYREHVEKDPAFERRFQQVFVGEPSVPDTVSILRGLKERYELHHGVQITDAALVTAANLANRYIQGRFNPDKSIDLVDEACANARVQLDSRPEAIDNLERRKLQLEVEATALEREKDKGSKERLVKVRDQLSNIKEELEPLKLRFEKEKGRVDEVKALREKLEDVRTKIARAERNRDLALAADLKYGAVPDLERQIAQIEADDAVKARREADAGVQKLVSDVVGPDEIAEIVSRWTGIPVNKLSQTDREKVLDLAKDLRSRVVGQDHAVDAIAEAVLRSRAGMSRPGRPMGSFLFCGPSGVGKTELCKSLAFSLFNDETHMVRIDMSEYMEQHSVARLIGAPPGYVGHEEGGQLTEAVRRRPYCVVLFDEVEKAHASVLNVLLQVLDDGRLTDGGGRKVDFSNTVIILTSNLGSADLLQVYSNEGPFAQAPEKQKHKAATEVVMRHVKQHFRPEFLNRLDDIVVFHPLSKQVLHEVVQMQVAKMEEQLRERNIRLVLTPAATEASLRRAYDPVYGARPLRRFLEKHITTQVSVLILQGQVVDNAIIHVDVNPKATDADDKNFFAFRVERVAPIEEDKGAEARPKRPKFDSTVL